MIHQENKYIRSSLRLFLLCFKIKITKKMKSSWEDWNRVRSHGNYYFNFIAVGDLSVELLAYQVSMGSAA